MSLWLFAREQLRLRMSARRCKAVRASRLSGLANAGLAVVLAFSLSPPASAHGDLDEQIAAVTAQIANEPHKAELYLKRGELHRAHEEWKAASSDFDHALELAPDLSMVHLGRGRLLLATARYDDAVAELDRFLAKYPDHAEALVSRARAEFKRQRPLDAARDFSRAIELSARPVPEFYLERAQALAAAGPEYFGEAINGLDAGTAKLGQPVTLLLAAIDLELAREDFDAALARVDAITARSVRKENWLARRGEILERAGRKDEARLAYEEARKAVAKLPPRARGTKAIAALEERLREKVK